MLIGSRISLQIRRYVTTTQQIAKSCELNRSAGPNLLPGGIVANGSQECVDADEDAQGNEGKQTDGEETNIKDLRVATGNCQHSGLSLSAARTLAKHHQQRLRRGRKVHPKVRKIVVFRAIVQRTALLTPPKDPHVGAYGA